MRCHVNWIELLSRPDLKSTNTKNVQVICKCEIYSRTFIIQTC